MPAKTNDINLPNTQFKVTVVEQAKVDQCKSVQFIDTKAAYD
jgi:hypothetical protein